MYDVPTPEQPGCGPVLPTAQSPAGPLRQLVFEHVRAAGTAARSDITQALGISPASATALTSDLIADGYLRETQDRQTETGRGRPKVSLEIVGTRHHVIGIKLSNDRHTAVLSDFGGAIIAETQATTRPRQRSLGGLMDEVGRLIDTLLNESGAQLSDISAVGVGISGIVDHQTGCVPWSAGAEVSARSSTPTLSSSPPVQEPTRSLHRSGAPSLSRLARATASRSRARRRGSTIRSIWPKPRSA